MTFEKEVEEVTEFTGGRLEKKNTPGSRNTECRDQEVGDGALFGRAAQRLAC